MSYFASVHDLTTGCFLVSCTLEADSLLEAESAAINQAAQKMKSLPREMDVRHLHQRSFHPTESTDPS